MISKTYNTSFKNLIIVLVIILVANTFMSTILLGNYFNGEFDLVLKITSKFILILLIVYLSLKLKYLTLNKKLIPTLIYISISIVLLFFSFSYIDEIVYIEGYFRNSEKNTIFLISCISVGFFEELLFRIFAFKYLNKSLKKGIIKSLLITSLFFALAHLPSIFNSENHPLSVLNQVLFAFIIGVFFQSIILKTNSLILVSVLHGLINYFGSYKNYLFEIIQDSIIVPYSFGDFISTFLSFLIIAFLIIFPISYALIRGKLIKPIFYK